MKKCYTENKIGYYLFSSASITLSAQISTLPLTLYIFHSFPTYFLFTNLILVPWSTMILYIGIAFLFLSGIPLLGETIVYILKIVTAGMNDFIHLINYIPQAQYTNISFNLQQALLAYLILVSLILFAFYKKNITLHFSGIFLLFFISFSYATPSKNGILFTYYQSNILLFGTEKQLFIACDNATLSSKYLQKLNNWKCQNNRANQQTLQIAFPSSLIWIEKQDTAEISLFHAREKSSTILLDDEMKSYRIDSSFMKKIQDKKILIGKGVSKKKKEIISNYTKLFNITSQNIQSEPFIIK